MKISIITICFNSKAFIQDALDSFFSQDYHNKELVVIDGGSTDGTKEILDNNQNKFGFYCSEKDAGLYDALNKGIDNANGAVVGILHSDDLFASTHVLSQVASNFSMEVDAVYGDLNYVKEDGETIHRKWISGEYKKGLFQKGWMPPHPTFYCRRGVFHRFGKYNTDFKLAADYELMLRFIEKEGISLKYIPKVLSSMRVGGTSNSSLKNRLSANKEDALAWKVNNLNSPVGFRLIKPLSKLKQFLS